MEREIRFRGKRTDTGEWVFGNLLTATYPDGRKAYLINTDDLVRHEEGKVPDPNGVMYVLGEDLFMVRRETVGQYSGLHDSKGNPIYEGDTLKFSVDNPEVTVAYRDGRFGMQYEDGFLGELDTLLKVYRKTSEVTGDIFE